VADVVKAAQRPNGRPSSDAWTWREEDFTGEARGKLPELPDGQASGIEGAAKPGTPRA
jgi:hypothetical protein